VHYLIFSQKTIWCSHKHYVHSRLTRSKIVSQPHSEFAANANSTHSDLKESVKETCHIYHAANWMTFLKDDFMNTVQRKLYAMNQKKKNKGEAVGQECHKKPNL
jgi:hypothetical protein